MAIITLSRQKGSLGDEIGAAVADQLGYSLIDRVQIGKALSKYGFPEEDIERYDEKKPSFWQALTRQKRIYPHLIQAVVYEIVAGGDVVIVGRGTQLILQNIPGTFHVRVVAPFGIRAQRLSEQTGYEEKFAEQIVRRSDRDSSGYIRTYFDTDWDDSRFYDLVINTRTMKPDTAVKLILDAVDTESFQTNPNLHEQLYDLGLTQKGEVALLSINGAELVCLEVQQGIACLTGAAVSPAAVKVCERTISEIEGIIRVENKLNVLPETIS